MKIFQNIPSARCGVEGKLYMLNTCQLVNSISIITYTFELLEQVLPAAEQMKIWPPLVKKITINEMKVVHQEFLKS